MPARRPTILATSGGYRVGRRIRLEFGPLVHHAVALARVRGARPRMTVIGTASGDQQYFGHWVVQAGQVAGFEVTCLDLFPMPSVDDIPAHLLAQDVIWVNGGSVANLLAVWAVHDLEPALREAWRAGVVLAGVSAGSICWYRGGSTDSFGPDLRLVDNGLGFLPYGNGVHYDSEPTRRPFVQDAVARGALPETHCTDDGVGMVYEDTELVEVVSERPGQAGWIVTRDGDGCREQRLEPRLLPNAR